MFGNSWHACDLEELSESVHQSERQTTGDMWETESFPRYNIRSRSKLYIYTVHSKHSSCFPSSGRIVQWCRAVPMAHVGLSLAAMPRLLQESTFLSQNVITFQFPRFSGRATLAIIISVQSFNFSPFYLPRVRKLFALLFLYSNWYLLVTFARISVPCKAQIILDYLIAII